MSSDLQIEQILEQPMVNIAYDLLTDKGEPMLYLDIMQRVSKTKQFTPDEQDRMTAQLYTEINVDGRFICVGRNLWGLKHWYTLDQSTDSAIAANVKDDDDLAEELLLEEDED